LDRDTFVPIAVNGVVQLSAGERHSLALTAEGRMYAWGDNESGQLGTPGAQVGPVEVSVPRAANQRVVVAAAGRQFSLALRSDGTVWAWGNNSAQQLGPATAASGPTLVTGLTEVVGLAAGAAHATAVRADGSVWAWGDNSCGQLGLARDVKSRGAPVQIEGIIVASAVAAGECHSFALTEGGKVYAWGSNSRAQLGNDSQLPSRRGVPVVLDRATSISAGAFHGLAVISGGTVMAWGEPNHGALGTGTGYLYWTPRAVAGLVDVDVVAAGGWHSLALQPGGTAYGWGIGWQGQLGLGAPGERAVPVAIAAHAELVAGGWAHSLVAAR
jgi:alpha-tubulin suppressor-like RCC1 family protein